MVRPVAVRHRVVVVGGGFAGLHCTRGLARAPVEVTLVDRRNFHLFQPLLYQVATGALSPGDIASPIRHLLNRQANARVLLAEVEEIDLEARRIRFADGEKHFDTLVLAAGSATHHFGHDDWAVSAPGLKTVEDATEMRHRILLAFEAAEREPDPERRRSWLTFVVVGAGPTGVELAGALAEIAQDTLRGDFRRIDPSEARILLLEGADRALPGYPAGLSQAAASALERLGVEVETGTLVTDVGPRRVAVERGGSIAEIATRTVLWAAGVAASPLGAAVAGAAGAATDREGRVVVGDDLSIPGRPEVIVVGDLARHEVEGVPLPGLAPVAIQQGRHAARVIRARLDGSEPPPFRYRDQGTMAVIGRGYAVASMGGRSYTGFFAWTVWLFVHVMGLVEPENRLIVFVQWAWNYFTRNRGARLITGGSPLPIDR